VHTEGTEACQRSLDTVVKLPKARELFSEALDRFRDVTCIGLCNWANVHLCLAKKLMEHAAENGQSVDDIRKEFEEHCAEAIKRYKEALGYNGALPCKLSSSFSFHFVFVFACVNCAALNSVSLCTEVAAEAEHFSYVRFLGSRTAPFLLLFFIFAVSFVHYAVHQAVSQLENISPD
jgi:hypothetical protein